MSRVSLTEKKTNEEFYMTANCNRKVITKMITRQARFVRHIVGKKK